MIAVMLLWSNVTMLTPFVFFMDKLGNIYASGALKMYIKLRVISIMRVKYLSALNLKKRTPKDNISETSA